MPRTSARLIRMPREKAVRSRRGKPEWYVNRLRSRSAENVADARPVRRLGHYRLGRERCRSGGQGAGPAGTPVSTGAGAAVAGTRRRTGEPSVGVLLSLVSHVDASGAMEAQSTSWNADRHSHIRQVGLTGCRQWPAPLAPQLPARAIEAVPTSVCRRGRGGGMTRRRVVWRCGPRGSAQDRGEGVCPPASRLSVPPAGVSQPHPAQWSLCRPVEAWTGRRQPREDRTPSAARHDFYDEVAPGACAGVVGLLRRHASPIWPTRAGRRRRAAPLQREAAQPGRPTRPSRTGPPPGEGSRLSDWKMPSALRSPGWPTGNR